MANKALNNVKVTTTVNKPMTVSLQPIQVQDNVRKATTNK
jgi:hypothetical protein